MSMQAATTVFNENSSHGCVIYICEIAVLTFFLVLIGQSLKHLKWYHFGEQYTLKIVISVQQIVCLSIITTCFL